jgi:hypothetical protein
LRLKHAELCLLVMLAGMQRVEIGDAVNARMIRSHIGTSGSAWATSLVFAPLLHCLYTDACDAGDDQREQADPEAGSEDGRQQRAHTVTRAVQTKPPRRVCWRDDFAWGGPDEGNVRCAKTSATGRHRNSALEN